MSISFSIEMVIGRKMGGRGSPWDRSLGAVLRQLPASLVSEALQELWFFVQGGLSIFVVVLMPDGHLRDGSPAARLRTSLAFFRELPRKPEPSQNR